jgi:type III pantothenate kinase
MKNILAIDIGNTSITAGVFRGGRLVKKSKTPTNASSAYGRFFKGLLRAAGIGAENTGAAVISSVVPLASSRILMSLSKAGVKVAVLLGRDIEVPVVNRYSNKKEVGQDRLVNAFAAKRLYGAPAIIVDFGTAITFDIVSAGGEYLGGLILPGIEMSLSGLYRKTALLPKVELKAATAIIGKNTADSMRGGILFGFGAMCDGLSARYRGLIGRRAKVIATGGNSRLIKRYSRAIQIVDEDLTLKGLALLAP